MIEAIEEGVRFISYMNGSIRTPEGKLAAFWDEALGVLHVDGVIAEFNGVFDIERAMDIVNENYKAN